VIRDYFRSCPFFLIALTLLAKGRIGLALARRSVPLLRPLDPNDSRNRTARPAVNLAVVATFADVEHYLADQALEPTERGRRLVAKRKTHIVGQARGQQEGAAQSRKVDNDADA